METSGLGGEYSRESGSFSASSGIVRILRAGEQRVGLGFLVNESCIVTAAHVINVALGRRKEDASNPGARPVFVEFCLLPGGARARRAQLDEWHLGSSRALAGKDVATLRLEEAVPSEARAMKVSIEAPTPEVLLFGPVVDQPEGGWLTARLMEAVPGGCVQLNQEIQGIFRVQGGWSGGPVWHGSSHTILGMLVAKPVDEDGRTDVYAIPSSVLCEALPTQLGHLLTGKAVASAGLASHETVGETLVTDIDATDPGRLVALENGVRNLERVVGRLAAQLNRLERLTILPNYELPPKSSLSTLSDLPQDLTGARILVKSDVDIPGPLENVATHFKFERAAITLNEIAKRGGSALVLWGQGLTSVELLESSEASSSEWPETRLTSFLDTGVDIRRIESIAQLTEYPWAADHPSTITFLPNLVDISPEDLLLVKGSRGASHQLEGRAEEFCVQSRLVSTLSNSYDIFVLDDFRSTVFQLPSNVGLAYGKRRVIGRGLESDLTSLEGLVERCIYLGRRSTSQRIFICGSSRPDDLLVVETFLQSRLFDQCLLGPYPALVIFAAMGQRLSPSVLAELAQLSALNGRSLDMLLDGPGRRLVKEYSDRIILPTDFMLRHGGPEGPVREISVNSGRLATMGDETRISAIGSGTVTDFCHRIDESELVFHFGMLGRGSHPEVEQTAAVIRRYCESSAEAFMSGDHILAIAHEMGLGGRLSGSVTGAQTTSYYMTGVQLPGLVPFLKRQTSNAEG